MRKIHKRTTPKVSKLVVGKKGRTSRKLRAGPNVSISCQDAFQLLSQLTPGSVDLIVCSPPYCMGKEYDTSAKIRDFRRDHKRLAPLLARALKEGGSLCWQVGSHVRNGVLVPLDAIVYPIFAAQPGMFLRNRIIWTFGHGVHASRRFSGRHETILWFTKGREYKFNLDAVRVPQKYPGKRHYKGPRKGLWSGHPLGKNPSDVWDIPNVKSQHVEKTAHPCQYPVALVQRLIKALVKRNGLVVDPFLGSGSSAVAAVLQKCRFVGGDTNSRYVAIARKRVADAKAGVENYRPIDKPIHVPTGNEAAATRPSHFVVPKRLPDTRKNGRRLLG
jgi:adenine-specific DNA-methyltransferase